MIRFAGEPLPDDIRFLGELPYRSQIVVAHDPDSPSLLVCLFHCARNICECRDEGECQTTLGLYFGTEDPFEPKFCLNHYQKMHTPPNNAYVLIPT